MKKFLATSLLFILLFVAFPSPVEGSLIVINNEGEVVVNVLSSQDALSLGIPKRDYLKVKDIAATSSFSPDARVSIKREGEKVSLNVGEKTLDVTNWQEEIVEIEERVETQKISIALVDGKFKIEQDGVSALTDYTININPENKELSVSTPSGARFLSILPKGAAESVMRARVITKLNKDDYLELVEEEGGELSYLVSGQRVLALFNIFDLEIPVKAKVSALTGRIISVDQPVWLNLLGFLFF